MWLFSLLLFFSIASGKRPQYLLGAYPAMALLVGYLFDRALHFWPESFYRKAIVIPSVILIVLFALLAVGAPIAALVSAPEHLVPALGFSLIAAVFSVLAYRAWRGDRPDRLMVLPVGLVLVLVVYGVHAIIPAVEPYKSIRPYAEYVRDQLDLEPNTAWGMYRTYRARYIYYADRFTSDLREEDELQAFLAQPNRALVILRHRDYEALKTTVLADTEVIDKRQIGSRTRNFVLVSNRPSRAITTPDQRGARGRR